MREATLLERFSPMCSTKHVDDTVAAVAFLLRNDSCEASAVYVDQMPDGWQLWIYPKSEGAVYLEGFKRKCQLTDSSLEDDLRKMMLDYDFPSFLVDRDCVSMADAVDMLKFETFLTKHLTDPHARNDLLLGLAFTDMIRYPVYIKADGQKND